MSLSLLVLVHHGDAVGPDVDPMRPLSSVGRAATDRLAAAAAKRGVKPDVIWHSGKLRARQTAELFWKACNPFAPLTAERGLLPDDPPQWMRDRLTGETAQHPHRRTHAVHCRGCCDARGRARRVAACSRSRCTGAWRSDADGERWKELWRLEIWRSFESVERSHSRNANDPN